MGQMCWHQWGAIKATWVLPYSTPAAWRPSPYFFQSSLVSKDFVSEIQHIYYSFFQSFIYLF